MPLALPPLRRAARVTARRLAALLALALGACGEHSLTGVAPLAAEPAMALGGAGPQVVISQVYGGGGNTGATFRNDFIELYNAGTAAVSVAGWSVQYTSSTGSSWSRTNLAGSIAPGGYYLIQQAAGGGGTVSLPAPDAVGNINMSLAAGKVVLVANQVTIATGTGCPSGPTVIDLLGFGASTNCAEGGVPAATLTNTTAALRKGGGGIDTDHNGADFTTGAPNPRHSGLGLPAVASTVPASGAANVVPSATVSVTFNKPVTLGAGWFTIACAVSGSHGGTVSGSGATFSIDPASDFAPGENCTLTIVASQVADATDAATTMAANQLTTFTTSTAPTCADPFTPAYVLQGNSASSPLAGQSVTTKGVVVGDYEGPAPALRGFYLQDATGDGDVTTSDGIFVFNGNNDDVALGDVVFVAGTVAEFQGQTQLGGVSTLLVCASGASVTPADVTLPVPSSTFLEQFEGMLVRFPQTLTVTEHFQLGRFGEVVLSSGGRLMQPTHAVAPGATAHALQAQNDLNRLIVDDGSNAQNADPIAFARGGAPLSAGNTLRGGDQVSGLVGVLTYTWAGHAASGNAYRVRPVGALGGSLPNFVASNTRPPAPPAVGGSLTVASMNLLNYFNTFSGCTNGVGGTATACRGAENQAEFDRQSAKLVAAVVAMNADIVGLIELENDGYGASSAIADLVAKVNAATAPSTYAYLDVDARAGQGNALGTDAIKVGLIYKPARVVPIGATAALNTNAFLTGGDASPRNRPALAQAFELPDHARLVVSVNHFKSKGSACDVPDAGDGQGECSAVRLAAANELVAWLATDPTGIGDPDVLVIGDLNAYAREDAITALTGAGYTSLVASRVGPAAYSYAFNGQWGSLDHALASASLTAQVTGAAEWHINADEPTALDYNTNFKSAGQQASLYAADVFRAADHDPLLVGLQLTPTEVFAFGGFLAPIAPPPMYNKAKTGSALPVRFSLGGDRGMDILEPGYPASREISCATGAPAGALSPATTTGQRGLKYDASSDTYSFVWKTDAAWAGTCREFVLKLADASVWSARFRFSR